MPPYKAKSIVIMMVKDGVIEMVRKPKDIRIILRDYDIEGTVEEMNERGGLKNNKYGDYVENEL